MTYLKNIGQSQSKPLVGIEYVVETSDDSAKEPLFLCLLCDKRCDPRNIIPQVVSHRHRIKYLELHFPSVLKVLSRDENFNQDMQFRETILTKFCALIESKSDVPYHKVKVFKKYLSEKEKSEIFCELKKNKLFSEENWPNCLKEFKTIFENLSKKYNSRQEEEKKIDVKNFDVKSSENTRKLLTPSELKEKAEKSSHLAYRSEKYRIQVEAAIETCSRNYSEYHKNPGNHPMYAGEWAKFWSKRYAELVKEGKNANDYDYKPEWCVFWIERMKTLFDENIKAVKESLRKKHGLSLQEAEKAEKPENFKTSKRSIAIEISDESSEEGSEKHFNYSKKFRISREDPQELKTKSESFGETSRNFQSSSERNSREMSPKLIDAGPINLVSVCRFLTALEPELGLLADPVLKLLSKAVAKEKEKPNSSENLLKDSENFNILATVKEKLKGVLLANLISSNKIAPLKIAIQNISNLLHNVKLTESTEITVPIAVESPKSLINPVDEIKLEIAKTIKEKLCREGRMNISSEDLEALIESFVSSIDVDDQENQQQENIHQNQEPCNMENKSSDLSDNELKILLNNFTNLMTSEQNHLISYLRAIESTDPTRAENLKQFVKY